MLFIFLNICLLSEDIHRNDIPALKKNSFTDTYSIFKAIDWRDREWKKGDFIQTKNTKPQGLIGRINRFLVPKCTRDTSGRFMGSPGFVRISSEYKEYEWKRSVL